jgi:hypothetical protein
MEWSAEMFDFMKKLAVIVSIVFVVYSGVMFGMPYYRHYAFRTDAVDIVRFKYSEYSAGKRMHMVKEKLFEKAQEVGLPISKNDIKVERTQTGYWAYVKWQETVDILGQYQKTLKFEVEVSS